MIAALLIIAGIVLAFFAIIFEIADRIVYGPFVPESKMPLLLKKLDEGNCFASEGIIHMGGGGYFCKEFGLICKWRVTEMGGKKRISIISPMSRILDNKYEELRKLNAAQNPNSLTA